MDTDGNGILWRYPVGTQHAASHFTAIYNLNTDCSGLRQKTLILSETKDLAGISSLLTFPLHVIVSNQFYSPVVLSKPAERDGLREGRA